MITACCPGMPDKVENLEQQPFCLGKWEVSPSDGRVIRGDESTRLEPKVMEVLVYLASRQNEVVTRDDLEKAVWRGAVVGYDAVTSTVIKLRKALGDHARRPEYIVTVPKRGYKLIAPVRMAEEADQPAATDTRASPPISAPHQPSRSFRRTIAIGTLAVVTAIVIATFAYDNLRSPATEATQTEPSPQSLPSIIVIPFENLGDDPEQEQFTDGITEDLITDLSAVSELLVLASNTSFSLKGRQTLPQQYGVDLGVDYVLEGSVRRQRDAVRVNVQLVDTKTGYQKWAQRYDRKLNEVFAVQDELTNSIVSALAIKLTDKEKERLAQKNTNSLEAYDFFRKGQRLAKISSKETNIPAQQAYRNAINKDPGYGRAYGALAYTMAFSYRRGWTDSPVLVIDQALELAKKGAELDRSIPQTYWSLGYVHLMRKEYEKADNAVSNALAIAPNYADGYGLSALIKNALGKSEEAIALIEKGMKLNPYYTWDYPYNLGRAYYTLGRYEEAIGLLEDARARNENAIPVRLHLAASYAAAGRQDDADWEVQEIQVLSPTDTLSHLRVAHPISNPELMGTFLRDLRTAGLSE